VSFFGTQCSYLDAIFKLIYLDAILMFCAFYVTLNVLFVNSNACLFVCFCLNINFNPVILCSHFYPINYFVVKINCN